MKITTNGLPREIIYADMLSFKERRAFDYLDWEAIDAGTDSASFVRFRGELYDLGTFMRTNIPGWDGSVADSFSAGMLARFVDDGERVVIGTYRS